MKTKILEVVAVDLQISKIKPPVLVISASGYVSSLGWTGGELIPYIYIMPPQDGIYEFDFVATPPHGPNAQVIMPMAATYSWPNFPEGHLQGVRIYSEQNKLEGKLSDYKQFKLSSGGGDGPRGFTSYSMSSFHNITLNAIVVSEKNGHRLIVHGSILTYREDDVIEITKAVPQGFNPFILLLRLKVTEGNGPMKGTPKHFYFDTASKDNFDYKKVSLIYGPGSLVSADVINYNY